jgi:L-alanine-DL-glutamate epimerase-like enolase superfamily enzyme
VKISEVKVYCIKPFGSVKNSNSWAARKRIYNFVKVVTDDGLEGCALNGLGGSDPSVYLASNIKRIRETVVGKDPFDRENIYMELNFSGSPFHVNRIWNSMIDIALWDIAGKAANLPIYKLVGAYRDKVRAYASTLAYPAIEDYINLGRECRELGFTAYKLHGFNEVKKDIELCEAVRAEFPDMDLMLDSLCSYDRKGALEVGRVLDRLGFYWFESPLREDDLEGHRILRQKLDIPISSTELELTGFIGYPKYIQRGATDIVRPFGDAIGGITPMLKTAHLCEAHHIKIEPQSFGHTLVQAPHLHISLVSANCDFHEAPVPEREFMPFMKDGIHVQKDGFVYAPTKPGLGYDIDWEQIEREVDYVL